MGMGGGTYVIQGDKYIENINFFYPPGSNELGQSIPFDYEIKGNNWYHLGYVKIYEQSMETADMDVIEINEAFAAQVLACLKGMDLAFDDERVNPNGGAIAIGHPLGASGGRLALTAINQLKKTGGKYALVTLCIGVGQGIAMVLESM